MIAKFQCSDEAIQPLDNWVYNAKSVQIIELSDYHSELSGTFPHACQNASENIIFSMMGPLTHAW